MTPTDTTVELSKQSFESPIQEYQFPNAIAVKLAIADELVKPLAKLAPSQRAAIDQILAETLTRSVVLSRGRHYFREQQTGEGHAD